jgi:hypothetical protein
MPLDPSIILGVKPVQIDMAQFSPMNALSNVMKFKQADQESQLNALKMQEYERAREEEEGTRNYLSKTDLSTPEGRMGLRKFGKTGLAYEKSLSDTETAALAQKKAKFEVQDARKKFVAQAARDTSQNPSDANITAYKEDLMANDLFTDAEKTQMAAAADRILAMPVDQRSAFMASQGASASELKPTTTVIDQSGQRQLVQTTPFTGAVKTLGTYADVPLPPAVLAQKKEVARAGASNITQTTEKKFSEVFAGKMAETDINKMTTAEKAPELAASANRIIDLVKQGNVFTGPIADVKLNIARALNVAGASNEEKIANTESLISATGQSTLDAIKGAGLGTNQGFTDKDLKFLQGVAGGTIQLTSQTLTELARLQHQAATRSAEAWNKRVTQLPKSATEGTGLSTEPIKVPPLSAATSTASRPAGVGPNWTYESDASGNKAWVSPDRKSFKEAK